MPDGSGKRREIPAGEFKAKCLKLMDEVKRERREYVITKHGKPVAKLVPLEEDQPREILGYMRGTIEIHGDIMSPLDVEWDAEKGILYNE